MKPQWAQIYLNMDLEDLWQPDTMRAQQSGQDGTPYVEIGSLHI